MANKATPYGNVLVAIPARLKSTRLPEKPLKDIAGQTLLQRVWERVQRAKNVSRVVVATDSPEIETLAKSFGAEVVMTSPDITTGSARVAAAWHKLSAEDWDIVVNVQGDMPFIRPELIDRCIETLAQAPAEVSMVTIATPIFDEEMFLSKNDVKVVVTSRGEALYFSRAPIPHSRDGERPERLDASGVKRTLYGFKHFGLYVYRPSVLREFELSEISALEDLEKLEQLRLLEMGYRIGVCIVEPEMTKDSVEVDTPADLEKACRIAVATERN